MHLFSLNLKVPGVKHPIMGRYQYLTTLMTDVYLLLDIHVAIVCYNDCKYGIIKKLEILIIRG